MRYNYRNRRHIEDFSFNTPINDNAIQLESLPVCILTCFNTPINDNAIQ